MKTYVKPELFYENFELSQHIANCDFKMGHTEESNCKFESHELPVGIIDENDTIFSGENCTIPIGDFEKLFENYCLQTAFDGQNLFNS